MSKATLEWARADFESRVSLSREMRANSFRPTEGESDTQSRTIVLHSRYESG
jgi:hypothetical protein